MNAQRAAEITEKTWQQRAAGEDGGGQCGWCIFAKQPSTIRSYCEKTCPIPEVFGDSCLHLELFDLWRYAGVGSIPEQDAAKRIYDTLRAHRRNLIAAAERIEARE